MQVVEQEQDLLAVEVVVQVAQVVEVAVAEQPIQVVVEVAERELKLDNLVDLE
jgi:hypothetical protein